jgi:hypothetical protein
VSPEARRLAQTFDALAEPDRAALAAFAAFLAARASAPPLAPVVTLRPAGETVMQAVKRLKQSYPMLERRALMQPVGALVSAHMLDGRGAGETIDALETLFAERYRAHLGARVEAD